MNCFVPYFTDDVRNVTYYPKSTSYHFGVNLTCEAKGNPVPSFEWINEEGKYTSYSVYNNLTNDPLVVKQ